MSRNGSRDDRAGRDGDRQQRDPGGTRRLANEQAALRRVATLVAGGAPSADVFDAVAVELAMLLEVGVSGLVRFEDEHTTTVLAGWGRLGEIMPVGSRLPIGGRNVISTIARIGKTVRMKDVECAGTTEGEEPSTRRSVSPIPLSCSAPRSQTPAGDQLTASRPRAQPRATWRVDRS